MGREQGKYEGWEKRWRRENDKEGMESYKKNDLEIIMGSCGYSNVPADSLCCSSHDHQGAVKAQKRLLMDLHL